MSSSLIPNSGQSAPSEHGWRLFSQSVRADYHIFFDGVGPLIGARAPGRLDVLGGVIDYSGGTVLEKTIEQAAFVAIQARTDGVLKMRSIGIEKEGYLETVTVPIAALSGGSGSQSLAEAKRVLAGSPECCWAGYIGGCLYTLIESGVLEADRVTGLNILIESSVPVGAGVSSSAAIEVATMMALKGHFRIELEGLEMARLCQAAENRVVGAPCGIMDQVTCCLGQENRLLVLKCQPHTLVGQPSIPSGWRFIGIDSRVKHSVGGRNYRNARIASLMGLRILQKEADDDWNGYLCNISPDIWAGWHDRLPDRITGGEFLARYGPLSDPMMEIKAEEEYRVRACTEHPILANNQTREFLALMQMAQEDLDEQLLTEAGALLLEAHSSYSERLDLGSPETDLLVYLIMERGPSQGLYGARISGGGSGGAVVVLCAGPKADSALNCVCEDYDRRTGETPRKLVGSSPGAAEFGYRTIV